MPTALPTVRLWFGGLALCMAACWPIAARAEQEFPGALQEAADMECVPTCLMCHTVNPGIAGTHTKLLGAALDGTMKLNRGAGDVDAFKAAWAEYVAKTATPDQLAQIKRGIEPGTGQDVCGPRYGCGASIARNRAGTAPAAVAAVVSLLAGLLLARRRR
jgi:hypothetical protein